MKFPNGREVQVGDVFKYSDGTKGTVVCSMDLGQYSEEHPKEQWGYLSEGVMVETEAMGLVHYTKPDSDMVFLHGNEETLNK